MLLYFVRHGETNWNLTGKYQGAECNISLNETGELQAALTGKFLSKYGPFDAIYSSPLLRAQETAAIISQHIDHQGKIILNNNLKEKAFGTLSGKTSDATFNQLQNEWINIKDPLEKMNKLNELEDNLFTFCQIETNEQMMLKCLAFLEEIKQQKHKKILIVTHGGTMTSFIKYMFKLKWFLPFGNVTGLGNCKLMVVRVKNDSYYMECEPTTEHLNN